MNNVVITSIFYCTDIISQEASEWLLNFNSSAEVYEVSKQVYSKIAYRENVDGIIVLARTFQLNLEDLKLWRNPLILVLESIEKPGNLGAILRTADAAGVNAVIICDPQTDVYNPNVIRSSLGCLFSNQVVVSDSNTTINFLQTNKIKIYSAALQHAIPYTEVDFSGPSAIIMGSEAEGLREIWRKYSDAIIKVPMAGIADSLNVSVASAILIYEAVRQRGRKHEE